MDGTPASLRAAVRGALLVGPLSGAEERVCQAVRDFLAQRFGATILCQNKITEECLMTLFEMIVEDPIKNADKPAPSS